MKLMTNSNNQSKNSDPYEGRYLEHIQACHNALLTEMENRGFVDNHAFELMTAWFCALMLANPHRMPGVEDVDIWERIITRTNKLVPAVKLIHGMPEPMNT